MNAVIIGSGNTATVLARLIKKNHHTILQIISRHLHHAQILAEEVGSTFSDDITTININADIYIIAVSDIMIEIVASQLNLAAKLVVHTSGAVKKEVLKNASSNYGVLYPLQSLRKENLHLPSVPFLIDGNNGHATKEIDEFAKTLSPFVSEANNDERMKLHISAVVVSNFSNHLYMLTKEYCDAEGVNFSLLLPLIHETGSRLLHYTPFDMQTGPASRGDLETIEKHKELLHKFPQLKEIYDVLSNSIMQFIK